MIGLEITWANAKSILLFFAPIIIPRLIRTYRNFRISVTSRPPPRPIPDGAGRALNLLFGTIAICLVLSLPFNPHAPEPNVFTLTHSRLNTPLDVIFQRLAQLRPDNTLTDVDTLLRAKLASLDARKTYVKFGVDTFVSCQYCSPKELNTYLLYYIPYYVLLPHLVHLLILGVATSAPFADREGSRWRGKFTLIGLVLAALDVLFVIGYDPIQNSTQAVRTGREPPPDFHRYEILLRALTFTICDLVCAALLYLSSTNRFFYKPPSPVEQLDQAVSAALTTLTAANTRLHAVNVTRNAVVRDKALKSRDDFYWQTMAVVENPDAQQKAVSSKVKIVDNIWEEEEVARAMSRAMAGQGGVDLAQLGVNANDFVRGATEGLE